MILGECGHEKQLYGIVLLLRLYSVVSALSLSILMGIGLSWKRNRIK